MELFILSEDIKVFCETAASFPGGILAAHRELRSILPVSTERRYFGISRPNGKGVIVYKAATEEIYQGEAEEVGCETFVIESGKYVSIFIHNYAKDTQKITKAFEKLTSYPKIDPESSFIEFYLNEKDVRCMVRLQQ